MGKKAGWNLVWKGSVLQLDCPQDQHARQERIEIDPRLNAVTTINISYCFSTGNNGDKPCVLNDWQLSFYGTAFDPQPDVAIRPELAPDTEILDDDSDVIEAEQPQISVDQFDFQSNVELFGEAFEEVEEVTTQSEEN